MVVVDNNTDRSACMDLDAIDYTLNGVCSKAATRDKDTAAAKVVNLTSEYNRIDINISGSNNHNNNNSSSKNNNNSNGNSNITKGSNKNFGAKALINHSNFVDIGRALITAAHMSNTNVANSSNSFQQLAQLQRSSIHLQHQHHPSQLHNPVSSLQLQQQQQQYHPQTSSQFYQRNSQTGNPNSGGTNGANQINNTTTAATSSISASDGAIGTVANTGGNGNSGVSRNAVMSNGPFYGGRLQFFKGNF